VAGPINETDIQTPMAKRKNSWITRRLHDALVWFGKAYIEFTYWSGRYEHIGEDVPREFWETRKPLIGALWHNRLLLIVKAWKGDQQISGLISRHGDGEIIARVFESMGHKIVRGSAAALNKKRKDRGGSAAFRQMTTMVKDGVTMAITPDGPKGPRYRLKDGIVMLAKYSGTPIVPATYSARYALVLNSWDKFLLPLPFSPGVFIWGNPIHVPADASDEVIEEKRLEVEQELQRITDEADRMMGRKPIEPGEPRKTPSPTPAPESDAHQTT